MTTTSTAYPELLDLDKLEALARAATPGPWDLAKITDRSIEHLCPVDRDRLSLLTVVHEGETPYGAVYRDEDAMLMAAIHPEQVLALIALARRAQREGEAPQADVAQLPPGLEFDGYHDSDEHYGKTILDLVRSRLEVDPDELQEGDVFYVSASWVQPQEWRVVRAGNPLEVERISPPAAPAATLSPLCGAQHAESGKESAGPTRVQDIGLYSSPNPYSGGLPAENWQRGYDGRRFIGNATSPAEKFYKEGVAALAAQQAAAAGLAKPELMRQAVASVVSRAGDDLRIAWLRPERCDVGTLLYCAVEQAAPSAPGTPEAPKPAFPISDDEIAALRRFWECATDGEGYDVDKSMMQRLAEMGLVQRKSGAYYMITEFGLYVLREYTIPRAAQLDGGQEGSD